MQPYLFAYIGYFQLVEAVDRFVFYDDVQYKNDGWINRNRLPAQGYFTVPVASAGLSSTIKQRQVALKPYHRFRRKWLRGFALAYGKAPYYAAVRQIVEEVFVPEPPSISALAERSVSTTSEYLGLATRFSRSSEVDYARNLDAQPKLLDLLDRLGTDHYVNNIGGSHLYQSEAFNERDIKLSYLNPGLEFTDAPDGVDYSILHLLAHHSPADCRRWLQAYTLTNPTTYETTRADGPQSGHLR